LKRLAFGMRPTTDCRRPRCLRWTLLALAALTHACVSTEVVPFDPAVSYDRIPISDVQIFNTEADVQAPFERVALIYASADAQSHGRAALLNAMIEKAAQIGADAIVLEADVEPPASGRLGDPDGSDIDRRARVLAIRLSR
jgi:GNAT superfamily N-acetyltransferase